MNNIEFGQLIWSAIYGLSEECNLLFSNLCHWCLLHLTLKSSISLINKFWGKQIFFEFVICHRTSLFERKNKSIKELRSHKVMPVMSHMLDFLLLFSSVCIQKRSFFHFLKVQNEWFLFKNDIFFIFSEHSL